MSPLALPPSMKVQIRHWQRVLIQVSPPFISVGVFSTLYIKTTCNFKLLISSQRLRKPYLLNIATAMTSLPPVSKPLPLFQKLNTTRIQGTN